MTKLIAEIGWNHMGDMKLAKEMISAAKESGADFAKFQTWSVDRLKSGVWDTDGRREIYEKAELSLDQHIELKEYCDKLGIEFMSSVFSIDDIKLYEKVGSKSIKIPSFESKNMEMLKYLSTPINGEYKFDHVFVSVGTRTLMEIRKTIDVISEMHTDWGEYFDGADRFTILHCVSSYPCKPSMANLPKIKKLHELIDFTYGKVGYSDHCEGVEVAKMALDYDVSVIEKHFTIDHDLPGRDNKFAILPDEMKNLSNYIEMRDEARTSLGDDYIKEETDSRENYTGRFDG